MTVYNQELCELIAELEFTVTMDSTSPIKGTLTAIDYSLIVVDEDAFLNSIMHDDIEINRDAIKDPQIGAIMNDIMQEANATLQQGEYLEGVEIISRSINEGQ